MEKNENDMNSVKRRGGATVATVATVDNFLKNAEVYAAKNLFSLRGMNIYRFPDWVINFIINNWIRIGDRNGGTYVKPGLSDDRMQLLRDRFAGGRRRKRKSRRKKRGRKSRRKTKRRRKRKTRKRR